MKTILGIGLFAALSSASAFELTSQSISHGDFMPADHEFIGFGCRGGNLSPQLSWTKPPSDTKSFALMVHDPDAPTGSGWWHWQIVNLPSDTQSIPKGHAAGETKLPAKARVMRNDYGSKNFGGACPPEGHGAHRYRFTIHALNVETLSLPDNPSAALVGYMVNAHTIEKATLEALYKR